MRKLILLLTILGFTNHGYSQWIKTSCPNPDVTTSLVVSGSNIFAGTSQGVIFMSPDNGANWTPKTSISPATYIYSFAVMGTKIFAATDNGIFLSADDCATWTSSSSGLPAAAVRCFGIMGSTIFTACAQHIYKSIDGGANWVDANNGIPQANDFYGFAVKDQEIIACTSNNWQSDSGGVFLSADQGANWQQIIHALPEHHIYDVAVKGNDFYAASSFVYKSYNNGQDWGFGLNNLPPGGYYRFTVSGKNLIAYGGISKNIALSNNDAANWTDLTFDYTTIYSLKVKDNIVFACNDSGVYKRALPDIIPCEADFSIDADTNQLHHYMVKNYSYGKPPLKYTWNWGDGTTDTIPLPSHIYATAGFYNICLQVRDSTGYFSSYCDSSFHALRTTNTMIYVNVVSAFPLGVKTVSSPMQDEITIYPNPADGELSIHSLIHSKPYEAVAVINMLGELMQEEKLKWSGDATINIKNLPAGIYFLQLKSESGSVVKKFVKE